MELRYDAYRNEPRHRHDRRWKPLCDEVIRPLGKINLSARILSRTRGDRKTKSAISRRRLLPREHTFVVRRVVLAGTEKCSKSHRTEIFEVLYDAKRDKIVQVRYPDLSRLSPDGI